MMVCVGLCASNYICHALFTHCTHCHARLTCLCTYMCTYGLITVYGKQYIPTSNITRSHPYLFLSPSLPPSLPLADVVSIWRGSGRGTNLLPPSSTRTSNSTTRRITRHSTTSRMAGSECRRLPRRRPLTPCSTCTTGLLAVALWRRWSTT